MSISVNTKQYRLDFFRVYMASSKHEGEMGEFEIQTRDVVEGLHNCREFSLLPECLDEANTDKSPLLLL